MKYRSTENKRSVIDALTTNGPCKGIDLLPHLSRQARFNVLDRMVWEGLITYYYDGPRDTTRYWKLR